MLGMDLAEALVVMRHPAFVLGQGDLDLADAVQVELNALVADAAAEGTVIPSKAVTPAAGVDGGLIMRPIEAMLRLARVTRPLISDDVYDWYRHWGWLRYLGVFSLDPTGSLRLSAAGEGVRANQRRVMSEDLGVGFGCLVAESWCRQLGAVGPITVVDVDLALHEGRRWLRSHGAYPVVGSRQPDYLLVYPDPTSRRHFTFKSLECKGTVATANTSGQLARACTQLASLELSGVTPQGIAVSTVGNRSGVRYFAVDPDDDSGLDAVVITDRDLARAREPAELRRSEKGAVGVEAGEFLATSIMLSLGTLADYAGNTEAAAEFLPSVTQTRLARRPRSRVIRETAEGTFRGVEYQLPTPGGSPLQVFMGVLETVDIALRAGDLDQVTEAQMNFRVDRQERVDSGSSGMASATSDDGSILLLGA